MAVDLGQYAHDGSRTVSNSCYFLSSIVATTYMELAHGLPRGRFSLPVRTMDELGQLARTHFSQHSSTALGKLAYDLRKAHNK